MDFIFTFWYKKQNIPERINDIVSWYWGSYIIIASYFDSLALPPSKHQWLSSYAHFRKTIGSVDTVTHGIFNINLNNFCTITGNDYALSIRPVDIDTDSYIRMKLYGKILDYQTIGGYSRPEEKINQYATNTEVPYIVQPYINGNGPMVFLDTLYIQHPSKCVILSIDVENIQIEGFVFLLHIFTYIYNVLFFVYLYYFVYYLYMCNISSKSWF